MLYCTKHPDLPAVLVSAYKHCAECSRALDREVILKWAHRVTPYLTLSKTMKNLEEMFGLQDFGFSSFPRLYGMLIREAKKDGDFVIPQKEYLQEVYRKFVGRN